MRAFMVLAFAIAVALAAAPANAGPHWHGHGYWGGPGLAFGLFAGAVAAGVAADAYCVRYEPTYDNWGHYIGRRPVNVC
jgi:peptidoglycan/LPS O-acetylase OafA/YrhL